MVRFITLLCLGAAVIMGAGCPAYAWDGSRSPHDGHHLVIVRPADWKAAGAPAKSIAPLVAASATFDGRVVPITGATTATLEVKFAGRYDLWVRVGQNAGPHSALEAQLTQNDKVLVQGVCNDDEGSVARGGAAASEAYNEKSVTSVAGGQAAEFDLTGKGGEDDGDLKNGILNDLADDDVKEQRRWMTNERVEKVIPGQPFYWWKIGSAELPPGEYKLQVRPSAAAANPPLLDAAMLTTAAQLVYPFNGDLNAPTGTYLRFRIDDFGGTAKSIPLSISLSIHHDPFYVDSTMGPEGFPKEGVTAPTHKVKGFTRWYKPSEIKFVQGIGGGAYSLSVGAPEAARGATQFATFPHDDAVAHEFDWNEPDGKLLALGNDYECNVSTYRDYARLHYEFALNATGDHLFPLLRGKELLLIPGAGAVPGESQDYVSKTMRLLGFNSAGSPDPVKDRWRFGWHGGGAVDTPGYLPYDEAEARRGFEEAFKKIFYDRALFEDMPIMQLADEPDEAYTNEFSAPFWRFETGEPMAVANGKKVPLAERARWIDMTGNGELSTVKTDLHDCVMEGEFTGAWAGFRAGIDNALKPKRGVYWKAGRLTFFNHKNVHYGPVGSEPAQVFRKAANLLSGEPNTFKIVYERGKAALYINRTLIRLQDNVPEQGGFSIYGPPKTIYSLRVRPIRAIEHIDEKADMVLQEKMDKFGDEDIKLDARDYAKQDEDIVDANAKPLKQMVEEEFVPGGGIEEAQVGFRKWCAAKGLTPALFGKKSWGQVRMLTIRSLVNDAGDRRRYYWSRRYSNYLTPHMYGLAAEALHKYSPDKTLRGYVGLSGHSLYMHQQALPMDLFQLAAENSHLMAGVSDWMSYGGWRWDSMQAVAYSVAQMNSGARRYGKEWGQEPISYPMMHCVYPEVIRAYAMLSNQVKLVSYWTYGPSYAMTEGYWSDSAGCHLNVSYVNNRVAQVDDILPKARMRPSRVALLYSMSNECWNSETSYADKRATFLGLSHEYYQPEMVTEEQVAAGALEHYDALYVLDPAVSSAAQEQIAAWVRGGGLLCATSNALTLSEYGEPLDLLAQWGLKRSFATAPRARPSLPGLVTGADDYLTPETTEKLLQGHSVFNRDKLSTVQWDGATVRARYSDKVPAFIEKAIEKGKVVYFGHRTGLTYSKDALRLSGYETVWADVPRAALALALFERKVEREVVVSESTILCNPMSTPDGTVLLLYNMRPTDGSNITIGLKEPAKPASVQAYGPRGMDMAEIPFEYRDGRAWITLPKLEAGGLGNVVCVRRAAKSADDRMEKLYALTIELLQSTDSTSQSTGIWYAGLNPQWKLAGQVEPFLDNGAWQVRLAAAEALWRLGQKSAAGRIYDTLQKEPDYHARCEMLYALARLGHPQAQALALQLLADKYEYVRGQAMRSVVALVEGAPVTPALRTFAAQAAELGRKYNIANTNWGDGSGWQQRLLALKEPAQVVDDATAAYAEPAPKAAWNRDAAADAIAQHDAIYAAYVKRGLPGGQELLIAVGTRRQAPELATALAALPGNLKENNGEAYLKALSKQHDKAMMRKVWGSRAKLPTTLSLRILLPMEYTFGANLGLAADEWDKWLAAHV